MKAGYQMTGPTDYDAIAAWYAAEIGERPWNALHERPATTMMWWCTTFPTGRATSRLIHFLDEQLLLQSIFCGPLVQTARRRER